MAISILPTKLYIPLPRPNLVDRTHLLDRLDGGLRAGRRLSVIAAPAGFGKTTLVASWVYSAGRPVASRAVAWLALDEADSDPARFFTYLIAALRQIDPALGRTAQTLLGTPQMPTPEVLMGSLARDIAAVDGPFLLILDDYQLVEAPKVHQALSTLFTHPLPSLHVVVITREIPKLPLARMRVRGEVTELGAQDLRFSPAEMSTFLQKSLDTVPSDAVVAAIAERTEGWPAGVQLLALALQRTGYGGLGDAAANSPSSASLHALTGESRHVADYLISEVLVQQTGRVQNFLRATSVLDELTAPLCDAVTGRDDSVALLARLDTANLFLIALDRRGAWYRYYRLFAEALRGTLEPAKTVMLHQRAMRWYEAQGMLDRAVSHALAAAKLSGDMSDAESLIRRAAEATARLGEVLTVRVWLDALPEELVRADGVLATTKGYILAVTGDLLGADSYARTAEAVFRRSESAGSHDDPTHRQRLGKLWALRSFIVLLKEEENETAARIADQALALLPEDEASWRVLALWSRAEAYERLDHLTEAIDTLWAAQRIGRTMRETLFAVIAEGGLAKLLNDHRRRTEAQSLCGDAIRHYSDARSEPLPLSGYIFSQLGVLSYEANELAEAQRCHKRALALGRQLGLDYQVIYARALAAPTWFVVGETERALEAVREGYRHASQDGYADADWFLAWETNFHFWAGDFVFARHWATEAGLSPHDTPRLLRIEQHITYARVLIVQRRLSDARHWLARLEAFAREHGLDRWLITVNILQAQVLDRLGDRPSALDMLSRAVHGAAKEGYVRAFLVEDVRVPALLPAVRDVHPTFVDRLLAAVPDSSLVSLPQPLLEPLTARELQVLRLISLGHSNAEVAETLVIAPG
jgi:LuxR family transcriptional regulator, maltose regulon positive regulatory protein